MLGMLCAQLPPDEGDDKTEYIEEKVVLSARRPSWSMRDDLSFGGKTTLEDRFSVGSRVSLLSGRSTEDDCCTR